MHFATITGDLGKNFWRPAPGARQPVMGNQVVSHYRPI